MSNMKIISFILNGQKYGIRKCDIIKNIIKKEASIIKIPKNEFIIGLSEIDDKLVLLLNLDKLLLKDTKQNINITSIILLPEDIALATSSDIEEELVTDISKKKLSTTIKNFLASNLSILDIIKTNNKEFIILLDINKIISNIIMKENNINILY